MWKLLVKFQANICRVGPMPSMRLDNTKLVVHKIKIF